MHLKNYVKNQLNNPADDEIVAEDEPPENATTEHSENLTEGGGKGSNAPALGKTRKDKEKALKNGDIHEHLLTMQNIEVSKISKKKTSKKFKAKAWKEWHQDFIRDNDADQMVMLS